MVGNENELDGENREKFFFRWKHFHFWTLTPLLTEPAEQRSILIQHIRALLNRSELSRCIVVLGVESNLGYEADHHQRVSTECCCFFFQVSHRLTHFFFT